jgi:hypothetical protein
MAAGATYEPIATTTLGSAAASYTFSSISSAYTDLVLICNATAASGDNLVIQFNGDNAANYSWTNFGGNGTTATSVRGANTNLPYLHYVSGINTTQANVLINIMNYSNTTTYKTAISRGNNSSYGTDASIVLWRSTAAISSITLLTRGAVNIASGSTFTLYGIAAA